MTLLFPAVGLLLTLLALALLGLGGSLAAWFVCGEEGRRDPLRLAVTGLLLVFAQAVGIALLLGALGLLRIELALAMQTAVVWLLHRRVRRHEDWSAPFRTVARRTRDRLEAYPALAILALLGVGSEALRGLFRPPLSWDSLMYHLYLAATWLQSEAIALVPARQPTAAYLFLPADGSLWLWWWMAPSHSELYVNLAYLPAAALLALATGAFARELGARRHWPVASFLVVLVPAVLRFVATQYVDILMAAALVAAGYYAARWIERPDMRDAGLAGLALGLAAGTKVVGLPFAAALGGLALVLARSWRTAPGRRLLQGAAAVAAALLLGAFFYVRSAAYGGGFLGLACAQQEAGAGPLPRLPAPGSAADLWGEVWGEGLLTDAFLGSTRPTMADLGIGPAVFLFLVAAVALPFVLVRERRRAAWFVVGQLAAQLLFWILVPYAGNAHILANVRYLGGALALSIAAAVTLAESRLTNAWVRGLALAVAAQGLLMLHAAMPRQVRWALAVGLVLAVVVGTSATVRRGLRRHRAALSVAALLAAVVLAPAFASFRVTDRERAFSRELTAHLTSSRFFAPGWGWLDLHGGDGTVAVSHAPAPYFVYPAMGPFLERRALSVHVNREAHLNPLRYADCDPRVDLDRAAWLVNLVREDVAWLHVARFPELDFPVEDRWARERPDLFRPVFADRTNRIYRFRGELPASAAAAAERSKR